jgi:transcription elongation GreA/GreB family factor
MNKIELLSFCIARMDDSIQGLKLSMQELFADAESDSKSTAGDKHETGRAMMQLAAEQLGKQLQEAEIKRNMLLKTEVKSIHTSIKEGSLVETEEATYFISAAIGKIEFQSKHIAVISTQAPLSRLLLGKKSGDVITFQHRSIHICNVS